MTGFFDFFRKLFKRKDTETTQEEEPVQQEAAPEPEPTPSPADFKPDLSTPSMEKMEQEKKEAPPAGKWRCSKCKRLMDDGVENCSFCGAGKGA